MGIAALTRKDDGTVVTIPESHRDWQKWVSAGRTRNWMLGDPLIDWLRLYGKDHDYIPKQELDSYMEELDFLKFIFERGQEFETGIRHLLEQKYEVATIAQDYRDIASLSRVNYICRRIASTKPLPKASSFLNRSAIVPVVTSEDTRLSWVWCVDNHSVGADP